MKKHYKAGGRTGDGDREWDGLKGDDTPDEAPKDVYAGRDSHVAKEARGEMTGTEKDEDRPARKAGGKVEKEHMTKNRHERRARKHGGRVEEMHEKGGKRRLDRPGRKRGGGVGSDVTPLSTAARTSDRREGAEEDKRSGGM